MNCIRCLRQLIQLFVSIMVFCDAAVLLASGPVVTALVITPDGKQVVAAQDHQLMFYELATLDKQSTIEFELATIHDLQFSPDGKMLAVAGGNPGEEGSVQFCFHPFHEAGPACSIHLDSVFSVRWLQDSKRLVTGAFDGNVFLFDQQQNKQISEFPGHSKGVTAVELLPNETMFVTGGVDQSLRVWEITTGKNVRTFNNHTGAIHDLRVRPQHDGLPMVASVADDRTVRFWQPTIGRMVRFVKLDSIPLATVWHPTEPLMVVTTSTGQVIMIDSRTASVVQAVQTDQSWLHAVTIDITGDNAIVAGDSGLQKIPLRHAGQ